MPSQLITSPARGEAAPIWTSTPEIFTGLVRFDALAPGHTTFEATDHGAYPLLAPGEFAVVDTADRIPRDGELFVIQWESRDRRRGIVQTRINNECKIGRVVGGEIVQAPEGTVSWWTGDIRQLSTADIDSAQATTPRGRIPLLNGLSHGPYLTDALSAKLVGRVIGYADSDLGNVLAGAAGWENEDEGNAAFNADEYIDAMYGIGHEPFAYIRSNGQIGWGEHYYPAEPRNPHPMASDEARFMAARAAYVAASHAYEMVLAELLRRGLDARVSL